MEKLIIKWILGIQDTLVILNSIGKIIVIRFKEFLKKLAQILLKLQSYRLKNGQEIIKISLKIYKMVETLIIFL